MRYYADSAATTPLHPEARRVMDEWNQREFGNASSLYAEGRRARAALDEAHEALAQHWGCLFGEVLFTGSGTEAANLAILGFALANPTDRRTIVLGAGDHHCVTHTVGWLGRLGYQVRWAPIDHEGRTRVDALPAIITEDVALVSVMMANNELGTIQPLAEIVAQARAVGAHVHTDAVQAFPTLHGSPWTVDDLGVDMVSISAHKFGGPKGIGALYVRGGTPLEPVVVGGGQERDMRAGTENVALALGMAEALRQALADPERDARRRAARDAFAAALDPKFIPTVPAAPRLDGHHHVRLPGADASAFLIRLDREGVCASSGSACSSGSLEPSHVLMAAGYSEEEARQGLRFSFGPEITIDQAQSMATLVNRVATAFG